MAGPVRHEIEKFANDGFEVDRDRIVKNYAKKKNRVLDQVRRAGNSGGYLPALVKWAAERERDLALARADAWVSAFTLFGEPADARTEEALKTAARLSAAGSISAIRGDLQLRSRRLRTADEDQGTPWHLDVERALHTALKEGVLRLSRQRISHTQKRHDFLEKLSPDDPKYKVARRFYLEAWSDSHRLVAVQPGSDGKERN
jgi:hypothetical protein